MVKVRGNLKAIVAKTRIATVCVTHNPEDAFELGDRIAVTFSGRIIQCDSPLNLLQDPINEAVKRLIAPCTCYGTLRARNSCLVAKGNGRLFTVAR